MKGEHDWHVQLLYTTFVEWGWSPYFSPKIDKAIAIMEFQGKKDKHTFEFPFELPKPMIIDGKEFEAKELKRIVSWGWRLRTNNYMHETEWCLSSTKDQAIQDATTYADKFKIDIRNGRGLSIHEKVDIPIIQDEKEPDAVDNGP